MSKDGARRRTTMRYLTGNILDYIGRPDAICITTNGFVTSKGNGVMGMGIAKSMADKYLELPKPWEFILSAMVTMSAF